MPVMPWLTNTSALPDLEHLSFADDSLMAATCCRDSRIGYTHICGGLSQQSMKPSHVGGLSGFTGLKAESLNLSLTSAVLQGNICSFVFMCDFPISYILIFVISTCTQDARDRLHLNELHVILPCFSSEVFEIKCGLSLKKNTHVLCQLRTHHSNNYKQAQESFFDFQWEEKYVDTLNRVLIMIHFIIS